MKSLFSSPPSPRRRMATRRGWPRLRLCVPAKLVSVTGTQPCLLLDVSRSGALVQADRPLAVHAAGYLRIGPVEAFSIAVRTRSAYRGDGICGVVFDVPLSKQQMTELRIYAQNYELEERRASWRAARDWVSGCS